MNYLKRTNESEDIEQEQFLFRDQVENQRMLLRYCPLGHLLQFEGTDLCTDCRIREMEVLQISKRYCDTCNQILFHDDILCEYCLKGDGYNISYKKCKK